MSAIDNVNGYVGILREFGAPEVFENGRTIHDLAAVIAIAMDGAIEHAIDQTIERMLRQQETLIR